MNSTPMLTSLDWIVFCLVMFATWAAIWISHRKAKENEDWLEYMLMGRRLTLPLFVATLVATWYGGIFGVTRITFESGIYTFITQGVFWYATYLIFAFFLVQRLPSFEATTLPELVGKMFGQKSSQMAAIFNFFNVVPVVYTISLGILLQAFLGGSLLINMSLGVTFVLLYSLRGGFSSVVASDVIQFMVMILSVILVAGFSVMSFGGWEYLQEKLPPSHFTLTGGHSWAELLVWGLIALSTLVDPNFYQRCFASQSTQVAKKGILISTCIWIVFDLCTTAGALYARALLPESNPNMAYLNYSLAILPEGLRGFFVAGIAATILSTMDSYLLIAGTSLSHDLFPKSLGRIRFFKLSGHQWSVFGVGILSILLAWVFDGNIRAVWKTLGSYSAACLLFPVMYGFFSKNRLSDAQFLGVCTSGIIATTVWRHLPRQGFFASVDEIYAGVLATSVTILILHHWGNTRNSFQSSSPGKSIKNSTDPQGYL